MPNAIRVTPSVAERYAEARGLSVAAASDELLRIVDEARESPSEPGRYRYRKNSDRLDVTAHVVNGCVIAVTVRGYKSKRGGVGNRD